MQSNSASSAPSSSNPQLFNGIPKTPERHIYNNNENNTYRNGYDSDGQHAPWLDNNSNDRTIVHDNEEELVSTNEAEVASGPSTPNPNPTVLTLSAEDMQKLKVAELRNELRKRGLATFGNKAALRDRLKDAIERNVPSMHDIGGENDAGQHRNQADPTYDVGSHWMALEQDGDIIHDSLSDINHEPTIPEHENVSNHSQKRNFSQTFDRPVFTGKATVPKKVVIE